MTQEQYEALTFSAVMTRIRVMANRKRVTVNRMGAMAGVSRTTMWRMKRDQRKPDFTTFLAFKQAAL